MNQNKPFKIRIILSVITIIFWTITAQAEPVCSLASGYPASRSKAVMTQVAHHRERGDETSQAVIDKMKLHNQFFITTGQSPIEIMKRSGILVQVRLQGKADILWTIEAAISCY